MKFFKERWIFLLAVAAVTAIFLLVEKLIPAIRAPFLPAPRDITKYLPQGSGIPSEEDSSDLPLKLPKGFSVSIFAKDLPGARVMRFDHLGNIWVSRTSAGAVTRLDVKNGQVVKQSDVFSGMQKPHGLAFDPQDNNFLYVAEENRIRSFRVDEGAGNGKEVLSLPSGGGHFTRTAGFGPDGGLYVSVGSSCNVCRESDQRRATILRFDPATKQSRVFARGLRNAVFFTWNPADGQMWATEMGRDWLGDDLPPDEINIIKDGQNYGWPICYGKNIHDTDFDKNAYIRNPCSEPFETGSFIDIPAHSAPLGLAFIPPNSSWPEDYWHDLIVAYHGSWNRSEPAGYKVVRYRFDKNGSYGGVEDFITGWLAPDGALGRPVDVLVQPGGVMYISDDKAGVIYRVVYFGISN